MYADPLRKKAVTKSSRRRSAKGVARQWYICVSQCAETRGAQHRIWGQREVVCVKAQRRGMRAFFKSGPRVVGCLLEVES